MTPTGHLLRDTKRDPFPPTQCGIRWLRDERRLNDQEKKGGRGTDEAEPDAPAPQTPSLCAAGFGRTSDPFGLEKKNASEGGRAAGAQATAELRDVLKQKKKPFVVPTTASDASLAVVPSETTFVDFIMAIYETLTRAGFGKQFEGLVAPKRPVDPAVQAADGGGDAADDGSEEDVDAETAVRAVKGVKKPKQRRAEKAPAGARTAKKAVGPVNKRAKRRR